mgnify:CR=1 FL=1
MSKVAKKITRILSAGNNDGKSFLVKRTCSGFTLIELTLVIFFMALIAGLTTPFVMSTLDRMELQTSARKVTSALRYARSEAITTKKPVRFNVDLTNNKFWVSTGHKNKDPRVIFINHPVRFNHFLDEVETEKYRDGKFTVTFFPQGNSSGGLIGMGIGKPEETENRYVINIDPITGKTKFEKKTK